MPARIADIICIIQITLKLVNGAIYQFEQRWVISLRVIYVIQIISAIRAGTYISVSKNTVIIYFNSNTWLAKDLFTVIWQHGTFFSVRTEWWRLPTLVCYATLRAMYMKWNTPKNFQSNGQLLRHYTTAYTLLRVMCKLFWGLSCLLRLFLRRTDRLRHLLVGLLSYTALP